MPFISKIILKQNKKTNFIKKKKNSKLSINKTISIISLSICQQSFTHLYHE
jgi:hypothetical protein